MTEVTLKAEARLDGGKGVARKLRATGRVPGIVYGRNRSPIGVSVDARELKYLLQKGGANALIALDVEGSKHLALAREVQRSPIRSEIIHVDFMEVSRDQEVVVDVPIAWVGRAAGEREGGIVEHVHTTLHVKATATTVPEYIDVDISELGLDRPITVADVTVPDGVTILSGLEEVIATCLVPRVVEEEPAIEAPEEPEVVGKESEAGEEAPASE